MLIELYNYLEEKDENFAGGLAVGLAVGLGLGIAVGIAGGIAIGLRWGIVVGIAVGIAVGLAVGIVGGLAVGIGWGLAVGIGWGIAVSLAGGLAGGLAVGLVNLNELLPINIYSIVLLVLAIVILMEVLMFYEPKLKKATYGQVASRKLVALFESSIYIINSMNIVWVIKNVRINFKQHLPTIIQWIGYIGIVVIILAIVGVLGYYWLKANKKMITKQNEGKR